MGCSNIKQAKINKNVPYECDPNFQIESDRHNYITVNDTKCGKSMIFQRRIIYPDELVRNKMEGLFIVQKNLISTLQNGEIGLTKMTNSVDTTYNQDFTPKGILRTQQSQQFSSTIDSSKRVTFKIDYLDSSRNFDFKISKHQKRRKTTMKMLEEIF